MINKEHKEYSPVYVQVFKKAPRGHRQRISAVRDKQQQRMINPHKPDVLFMGHTRVGKQKSPRCDAAKCSAPSGATLFAYINFIEK